MRKGFKIYFLDNSDKEFLISDYSISDNLLTMNEQLTEEENNKFTLTFDIVKENNQNNLIDLTKYLKIGRVIKLEVFSPDKVIKLVITSITPVASNQNYIWSITAQDYASVIFSKNNVGLYVDTLDEEFLEWFDGKYGIRYTITSSLTVYDFLKYESPLSVYIDNVLMKDNADYTVDITNHTITFKVAVPAGKELEIKRAVTASDIIEYILIEGFLQNEADPLKSWKTVYREFNESVKDPLKTPININLSSSNTYNALVEIALLTNSLLTFDYDNQQIDLIDKESNIFKKNFLLSPYFNLQDFSLNYQSDSFYPILYVTGGKDDNGLVVTMMPFLTNSQYRDIREYFKTSPNITVDYYDNPNYYDNVLWTPGNEPDSETLKILNYLVYLDNFVVNLEYFLNNNLIDSERYEIIFGRIHNELRVINLDFQELSYAKDSIEGYIKTVENKIFNYTDRLNTNETYDYAEWNKELENLYLQEGGYISYSKEFDRLVTSSEQFYNIINYSDLTSGGYIFQEVTESEYYAYQLPPDGPYSIWGGGPLGQNEKYHNLADNKYFVSSLINTLKPNFTFLLNTESTGNKTESLDSYSGSIIYDSPLLSWSSGTHYRYKWDIDIITNLNSFDISNIDYTIQKSLFQKNWKLGTQSYNDEIIFYPPVFSLPYQTYATYIQLNSNLSIRPTATRYNMYNSVTQINFPETNINPAFVYGNFVADSYINTIVNSNTIKIKKYRHHADSLTYWIALEQNSTSAILKVYNKDFTLITTLNVSLAGTLLDFEIGDKNYHWVNNKRFLAIHSTTKILLIDISDDNITSWVGTPDDTITFSSIGQTYCPITFSNYFGTEGSYTTMFYSKGTGNIYYKVYSSGSWGIERTFISGNIMIHDLVISSNILYASGQNQYIGNFVSKLTIDYIDPPVSYTNNVLISNALYAKKSLATYGDYLFYENDSGNIIAYNNLTSSSWQSSILFNPNLGGVKEILVEGGLLHALGKFNDSGITKERVITLNIYGNQSSWSTNPIDSRLYTNNTIKNITINNAQNYNLSTTIYDNQMLVVTTSNILKYLFLNYLNKTDFTSVSETQAKIYYNSATNTKNYYNAVWKNDEIWVDIDGLGVWASGGGDPSIPLLYEPEIGSTCSLPNTKSYKYDGAYYQCVESSSVNASISLVSAVFNYSIPAGDYIFNLMNYYDLLKNYKGSDFLDKRLSQWKYELTSRIKQKDQIIAEIKEIIDAQNPSPPAIESARLAALWEDLAAMRSLVGNRTYDWETDTFGFEQEEIEDDSSVPIPQEGKYVLLYENFKRFLEAYEPETNILPYSESIYAQYEAKKKAKQKFWFELKRDFGKYLYEGYYANDIENNSYNLYRQAIENFKYYNYPSESYSITYLDASDLIGKNIELISVGDYIKIRNDELGVMDRERNEVRVTATSRDLRAPSNISLTVDNINKNTTLIEKILANISTK